MKLFFLLFNLISAYNVVWNNTEITIPLNGNTYEHFDTPTVSVYKDGNLINTPIYYQQGVNHTSLTVVNSKHVKTFNIDYKAYIPEIGIESIQTIKFHIVDTIKPEFLYLPELVMPVKTKRKTEKEIIAELIYQDNYYKNEEIIVKIHGLDAVNINVPGQYKITYELIDPSFNIARIDSIYYVLNNVPPEIKAKQPIKISLGTYFNYLDYFTFSDEYNSNLTIDVDSSLIDFNKLGLYQIYVSVTNEVGLKTSGAYQVEVIDNIKPVLIVKEKEVYNYLDVFDFKDLIVSVSDNYDSLSFDDILISGYVNFHILGKYELTYSVSDQSGNEVIKKVNVEIKDLERPKIELLSDEIIINVKSNNINWYEYLIISDNYNDLDDLKITFDVKGINFNVINNYYLTVEVIDEAKNKRTEIFLIKVRDLDAPVVTSNYNDFITIDQYGYLDNNYFKKYFNITDNYYQISDINILIDEEINYFESNFIKRTFTFIDPSGNEVVIDNINILIIETRPPVIVLSHNTYKYYIGEEMIDLESFIIDLYDFDNNSDLILIIEHNINFNQVGVYEVIYKAYNSKINNIVSETLMFYVDSNRVNETIVSNVSVKLNENVDDLLGIILGDSVVSYQLFPKKVDTKTSGIKIRKLVTYDERGNMHEFNQEIFVEKVKEKYNFIPHVIVNSVAISFAIVYYIIVKKKYNTF